MDVTGIEMALNALITEAAKSGGFVWIVDKKGNNFALRLSEPVTLRAFMPSNNEREGE